MKQRTIKVIKINLLLLLIFFGYYFLNKYTGFYIPCIFHSITGLKCPGCGITRLLFYLIKFDYVKAFLENPLVFIYIPFIIAYYVYATYLYIYDRKDKIFNKIPNYYLIILLSVTIIYGVVRNFIGI